MKGAHTDYVANGRMINVNRKRTVYPATPSEPQQIKLMPSDLTLLLLSYIQTGLVYQIPATNFSSQVERLAETLSRLLVKFYPLAGRLTTNPIDGGIYILCNDSGVDFIEAAVADLSVADLIKDDVPPAVKELFALHGAVNLHGDRLPLLVVQVTQLKDGAAVCFMMNHAVVDGTSFWHFINSWAHLCKTNGHEVPMNPIFDRSLLDGGNLTVRLGLDPDGNFPRFCPPPLRFKIFHFSGHVIKRLKDRANRDSPVEISSLQALSGHLWAAVTRARGLSPEEQTVFCVVVDCRARLAPPVPRAYFGSALQSVYTSATAGEVSSLPLSFPAGLLNNAIRGHVDGAIRQRIEEWHKKPVLVDLNKRPKNCLTLGSSPHFDMYENDFGWGRAVAVVRGPNHRRSDGHVLARRGREGQGSVDLELFLMPSVMIALETDSSFISPPL